MSKKKITCMAAIVLLSAVSFQSCIGSFSLTNKVLSWNRNVSNKFVNELVFFAFWILPVYEVTAVADLLVINSIEFWSGNKPLEANNQVIETDHGNYYINAMENGYKVVSPDGNKIGFDFNVETQTWSFNINDNQPMEFLQFIDNEHVKILSTEGSFVDVEISEKGVSDYISSMGMQFMALER